MKGFLLALTLLLGSQAIAQDSLFLDSTEAALKDLTAQVENYQQMLRINLQKRKQDSLARADLLKQIQLLRESDKLTQSALQERIREIERRDSMRYLQQKQRIAELQSKTPGYPVVPYGDTLFLIYTKLGPTKAPDRAANVTEKIQILVREETFYPDSLLVQEHDGTVDIMYRNLIVSSTSDWDALWADHNDKLDLANSHKEQILAFVIENRNRSSIRNITARIGLTLLVIGGVIFVLYLLSRLMNGLKGWAFKNRQKYFTGIRIRNYEFLPPARQLDVVVRSITVLKWILYINVFYLSLPILFSLFPITRGFAQTLLGWILSPAKEILWSFWNYLPNVFTIGVIYVITHYSIRFLRFISSEIDSGNLTITGFHPDWALPTFKIIRFLIYAFMFVVIFPYLPGSDSEIFKGVSVFLGILFSLGSSSAIANAVAGLVITYMRPFRSGDRVKIGEITGEVIEKSLLVTRIRTTKNEDITVPNSSILTGHTINYSSSSQNLGLVLHTSVTIGYDVPWRQVHELLIDAALSTDGVNVSKDPFVLQTSLDDYYVSYQLNAFTDVPERMPAIYSELHANIQDKFNEAGVEIMSPHYRAVRDGSEVTIPKKT
ncbi:MAG: mechanosensitive ion channel [Ekhidna sp.]